MLVLGLSAFVLATSLLSGVFGVAGGMILMGGLLWLMPVAEAMVLHGIIQFTSNGWRALIWARYIRWSIVLRYLIGLLLALGLFFFVGLRTNQHLALLILGAVPILFRLFPMQRIPDIERRGGAELAGVMSMTLQLLSGVSGPTLDTFMLRSNLGRREIVASKAACQTITHLGKLVFFGLLVAEAASGASVDVVATLPILLCAILGTSLGRIVLERLTDQAFRKYTWALITTVSVVFILLGLAGLAGLEVRA